MPPMHPVRGITVRHCVFWCDRARIFLFAHESQAPAIENLNYHDCDIVHYVMTPFLLEPGELMPIRNARFENFQIEGDGQRDFITLRPTVNQYMKVKKPGSINGIVFKNIFMTGEMPGPARWSFRERARRIAWMMCFLTMSCAMVVSWTPGRRTCTSGPSRGTSGSGPKGRTDCCATTGSTRGFVHRRASISRLDHQPCGSLISAANRFGAVRR